MIISHKYKLLFIGLPFSASSAISKELYIQYEGKSLLRKHSLYWEFKKVATKEERKYFVFAVLRNPMEVVVTMYEKMRANAKGNFTNAELFVENGGHITKKHRQKFDFIHNKKATFQQYFKKFFKKPYDNLASLTFDHCDYIISYENIAEEYLICMKKAGVKDPKPLPIANKTSGKNEDIYSYYTDDIRKEAISVFGPFFERHNYSFPASWGKSTPSIKSRLYFMTLRFLRKINHRFFKKHPTRLSLKGTIYGDIQRKNNFN